MDTIQFVIKLKDLVSGGMRSMANTGTTSFKRIDDSIAQTQRKMDNLAKPVKLSIDTSGLRSAHHEIDKLSQKANGGRSGGLGIGGMLGMSATALAGVFSAAAIAAGTGYSINEALKGSQQKASFQVLAGDQQGGKLYSDITKFAQDSIFGNELYKNAQTLLSFGINAQKIMPDLKMLGDVSMGDTERLGALTLAFSQTQSAGKLMGQDLLQYINAGFNPLKELSEMTGKSMSYLKDKMSEGAISAGAVQAAFEHATGPMGKFYQMTEKIADTPFGKWEAFKGQIQGLALQFGTALLPAVSKVLGVLPPLLETITPMVMKLVPIFTSLANIAMTVLVPALKIVAAVLNAVLDIVGPVVQGVEYIIEKIFGTFDDGKIEQAYQDAGELSGKSYVGGIATEVKDVKDIVGKSVTAPGVVDAWKDAASVHGKTYMEALKESMDTWDLTVPVTIVPNVRNAGSISDMRVDENGNLVWDKPKVADIKDTPHTKALFDTYFKTGNYKPKPVTSYSLAGDFSGNWKNAPAKKVTGDVNYKIAPEFFTGSNSYRGIAPQFLGQKFSNSAPTDVLAKTTATNIDKMIGGGDGGDNTSKAIAGGGRKQIIINVNKEFNSGGIHINASGTDAAIDDVEHRFEEMWLRILQSANAADD